MGKPWRNSPQKKGNHAGNLATFRHKIQAPVRGEGDFPGFGIGHLIEDGRRLEWSLERVHVHQTQHHILFNDVYDASIHVLYSIKLKGNMNVK